MRDQEQHPTHATSRDMKIATGLETAIEMPLMKNTAPVRKKT